MSDQPTVYQAYQGNTYLFGGNAPYVEEMYENYLTNPGSVPDSWREYFDALQHVPAVDGSDAKDVPHLPVINARRNPIGVLYSRDLLQHVLTLIEDSHHQQGDLTDILGPKKNKDKP